jgi:ABC-2 type transport system ATP-binding protein
MITVEHLTKCYGDFKAVDDLSFEIEEEGVYGFLGPNGAGKSTTMNIMTGCLSATDGHVTIDGYDIFEKPREAKKLIGYLPEQPPLYMNETPVEYLRFVGEAKGLKGDELESQIAEVMEQTRISEMRNRRISALSKGYKQRVGIAQALLGNPKIIILDEPTVGLDPLQIIEIRDLIRSLGEKHTVILSSHILSEVQTICEKILIINHGKLIAFDEPEHLENRLCAPNEITFTAEADSTEVREILSGIEHLTAMELEEKEDGMTCVQVKSDCDNIYDISRQLFFAFAAKEKALLEVNLKKANLEDIFIELTDAADEGVTQNAPDNGVENQSPGADETESEVDAG